MKIKLTIAILFCTVQFCYLLAQVKLSADKAITGTSLLREMHTKYYKAACKCYTFSQKNTHYKNDSVIRHSEWHEAVEFPDKFRIDFGNKTDGNYVIYKNDSAFNYKSNQLVKKRADSNSLILLIGGMFYREFDDALKRFKNAGYDPNVLSEQQWNDQTVYVIGAELNDLVSNQIWVDKKTLYILRIIERRNDIDYMDMRFESHQAWCKGNIETKVSFRRNGKLEQMEEYYDIKIADAFPQ